MKYSKRKSLEVMKIKPMDLSYNWHKMMLLLQQLLLQHSNLLNNFCRVHATYKRSCLSVGLSVGLSVTRLLSVRHTFVFLNFDGYSIKNYLKDFYEL